MLLLQLKLLMLWHSELMMVGKLVRQLRRLHIFDSIYQERTTAATVALSTELLKVICSVLWFGGCLSHRTLMITLGSTSYPIKRVASAASMSLPLPFFHLLFLCDNEAMLAYCLLLLALEAMVLVDNFVLEQLALVGRRTGQVYLLVINLW